MRIVRKILHISKLEDKDRFGGGKTLERGGKAQ